MRGVQSGAKLCRAWLGARAQHDLPRCLARPQNRFLRRHSYIIGDTGLFHEFQEELDDLWVQMRAGQRTDVLARFLV